MPTMPPEVPDGISLMGQLPGFLAGLLSSAAIAVPLYFKQKREAAASERRIVLAIQQQQQQENGLAPMLASTMSDLAGRQEYLLGEFRELRDQFERVVGDANYDRAIPLARPYTAVARALASEKAERQLNEASAGLDLNVEKLRQLHASLFPPGYELAGVLRKAKVWVGIPGSKFGDAAFVPPEPSEVPKQLTDLLDGWNLQLTELRNASVSDRLNAIASFHHRLVSIHPFLDGNGILARLLSGRQLRELLAKDAVLVESAPEYISALRDADGGDIQPLVEYFIHASAAKHAV